MDLPTFVEILAGDQQDRFTSQHDYNRDSREDSQKAAQE
jgi:hypothetical protein